MVILDDKLYIKPALLKAPVGVLRITKIGDMREQEGKFGPYKVLDSELAAESGEEFKHGFTEKERAKLITWLGRDTDKWLGAQLKYKIKTKVGSAGETEIIDFESAVPLVRVEKINLKGGA